VLTSVVIMKCMGDSGFRLTLYKPVSDSWINAVCSSLSHSGCVKSPVPTRFKPLILAKRAISLIHIFLLVARLKRL